MTNLQVSQIITRELRRQLAQQVADENKRTKDDALLAAVLAAAGKTTHGKPRQ